MNKLKPCPICGGEAECFRTVVKTKENYCDAVVVRCKNCGVKTKAVLFDARKHPHDEEYEEAKAAWNTIGNNSDVMPLPKPPKEENDG